MRNLRGFPGAGRGDEHEAVAGAERVHDGGMNFPDWKHGGRHGGKGECLTQYLPQDEREQGGDGHQSSGHEFAAFDEAHSEEDKQHENQNVGQPQMDVGNRQCFHRDDVERAQGQRDAERERHDEGHFAFGLEKAHEAARDEQHDVNPENNVWCHSGESISRERAGRTQRFLHLGAGFVAAGVSPAGYPPPTSIPPKTAG